MIGLLTKDFLTVTKKYGLYRIIVDILLILVLMFVLKEAASIYISFLLLPLEITSLIISLATCDEEWKWGKYAISLPVSKAQIVQSRYVFAVVLALVGFVILLLINSASYVLFPSYAFGFYLFVSFAAFCMTLLFLAIILPSNYSMGVNAGFVVMMASIVLLLILGLWSNTTGNVAMMFLVDHFQLSLGILFVSIIILYVLSYFLSVAFFKRKHR